MNQVSHTRLSRDGTFAQRTEAIVREMILSGSMRSGERLNEVALAQSLGISRGPLREAIQRLVAQGLLRVVSHRGTFVRTFERREVEELYDLRTALEMYVVRLVCARASDEDIEALYSLVGEAEATISSGQDAGYPSDPDLHSRLVELSGNAVVAKAMTDVQRQIALARWASATNPARAREALLEHQDLLVAIVARDEDAAALMMRRHLGEARRSALEALGFDSQEPARQRA